MTTEQYLTASYFILYFSVVLLCFMVFYCTVISTFSSLKPCLVMNWEQPLVHVFSCLDEAPVSVFSPADLQAARGPPAISLPFISSSVLISI